MDPILYWNDVALEVNRVSHTNGLMENTGPFVSARTLNIVHIAMYDAYVGTAAPAGMTTYETLPPAAAGASPDAAVAAAAHATLVALYPGQRTFLDRKLLDAGLGGAGVDDGHDYGQLAATAVLRDRTGDPGGSDLGYTPSLAPGRHRVDPDNPSQGFSGPFFGARSRLFATTVAYTLPTPPQPMTPAYRAALQQVVVKGIAPELAKTPSPGSRTAEETLIGIFWGYDGSLELGTPPRLYNQIVRAVAIARGNTVAQNARLFALVNTALADAGVLAWREKYKYEFWRPVLGVREHDRSMGPTGSLDATFAPLCDPGWLPLGGPNSNNVGKKNFTPNFPAYPSGHATFGAAALHMTRLFYGVPAGQPLQNQKADDLFKDLTFVSDEFNGKTQDNRGTIRPRHARAFKDGLWQMIIENGLSRVFLGVHWSFDAFGINDNGDMDLSKRMGGIPLGFDIAEDIFKAAGSSGPKRLP
jgi:Vanadium chloroperoxidase N-terminal domain